MSNKSNPRRTPAKKSKTTASRVGSVVAPSAAPVAAPLAARRAGTPAATRAHANEKKITAAPGGPHADLRRVLGQFATGVTIVTARAADGAPVGLTVNSFASVSLDPPLVLWSVARTAASFTAFISCRRFRVHVLAAGQLALAQKFAIRHGDKFERATAGDLPIIDGCVAWFECDNRKQYDEGDHVILIGTITAFANTGGAPLVFHDGRYVTELVEKPLPAGLRDTVPIK